MIDVSNLTANELATKLKSGELSSVDLCNKYLEMIKKFEPEVKAWAHLDKKLLLEKAEEADNHRKSGKPLGPLHGMPVAIKDIIGGVMTHQYKFSTINTDVPILKFTRTINLSTLELQNSKASLCPS